MTKCRMAVEVLFGMQDTGITRAILLLSLITVVFCDIYLHNPRGSNNRLNENTPQRTNGKRLFDSQNNNKGGYAVGNELVYYAGSQLLIEWTNQHSCHNPNINCNIVLQYMCHDDVRDGATTKIVPEVQANCKNKACTTDKEYGLHENYTYYEDCKSYERNKGLFTADQKLKGQSSIYTRQNSAGTRYGYECPEERDHYPYWRPTPWIDIAVLSDDAERCHYYKNNSENIHGRYACVLPRNLLPEIISKKIVIPNTKLECEEFSYPPNSKKAVTGVWKAFHSHNRKQPECQETEYSRDNHLGNTIGGQTPSYMWTVPELNNQRCALRIRYNISTTDYNGWDPAVNATVNKQLVAQVAQSLPDSDEKELTNRGYRVQNNPQVQIFPHLDLKLQLNINTAQTGRVFQDRSHSFRIMQRPTSVPSSAKIHNLNVRGKRGNIVQVYPAVEYDFVPKDLLASKHDFVHIQWTGSDNNPKGYDGQGKAGTDRSNIVLLANSSWTEPFVFGDRNRNYPAQSTQFASFLGWPQDDVEKLVFLSSSAKYTNLDAASPTFDLGLREMSKTGEFHYMSTRNNAFSNREQKGRILVIDGALTTATIGRNGGNVTVGSSLLVVGEEVFPRLTKLYFEEWLLEDVKGNLQFEYLQPEILEDLASNVLILEPEGVLTDKGKRFEVHLALDSSFEEDEVHAIWTSSSDASVWKRINVRGMSEGKVVFEAKRGGLYLLRHESGGTHAALIIVPIVVGFILLGTLLYWKIQKPQCITLKFMLGIHPPDPTTAR